LIRAVVDSNIAISGYFFGGVPLQIIQAAISHRFTWVTSPVLIAETQRVMRSEKFGLTFQETQKLMRPLLEVADIVQPNLVIDVIKRCPADNRVLECAVEGECSFIITGDRRDLLSIKNYQNIEIIKARDFLSKI
jgi:putative PIN family toxin of toxin-antitoxin system